MMDRYQFRKRITRLAMKRVQNVWNWYGTWLRSDPGLTKDNASNSGRLLNVILWSTMVHGFCCNRSGTNSVERVVGFGENMSRLDLTA